MLQPVVIDGIRTPIGKLNGAMKDIQPEEIAAFLLQKICLGKLRNWLRNLVLMKKGFASLPIPVMMEGRPLSICISIF